MIGSLRRLTAYPMTWSSVLALSILLSSAAAAQNVNSNLCGTNSKNGTERILSPAQTKELVRYVDGLRQGSHVFNWTISGHYAADQLGFGKRFAATYGQAVEEVKLRMNRKRSVHIDEIIEYLGGVLSEEQFIDGLIAERRTPFSCHRLFASTARRRLCVSVCASRHPVRASHVEPTCPGISGGEEEERLCQRTVPRYL